MGFWNALGKVGSWVGNAVKKVGDFGGNVVNKIGSFVKPAYDAANNATGGLIGNAIESIPVVGGIAKAIGGALNNPGFMNGVSNTFGRMSGAGNALQGVGDKLQQD